jgi:hypothetical protein
MFLVSRNDEFPRKITCMGSYQHYRQKPNAAADVRSDVRRLSGKLLAVFDQACDELEYDVALHLLVILEERINFEDNVEYNEHATTQGLAAAHERLKQLRLKQLRTNPRRADLLKILS